jgi:hypothetical protein
VPVTFLNRRRAPFPHHLSKIGAFADKGDFDTPLGVEIFRVPKRHLKDFELRAPRKIDSDANRGLLRSERLRIGASTKPNHSKAIS